uniref:NADH-ubiquinone oxidoreductase chain 3 n=1 Tax=Incoltorrida madagassica TaxID=442089 RepID=A0A343A3L4_9COLE|nr:NADH dehydrogenase subunit 3 [Incoltorrida madagassica]AOY39142.1 NADH dehydrogenase subunit 3 [Incoltorrida madagassica]
MIIMLIALMFFFIAVIIMFLTTILSKKSFKDREKSSPFECGFDPKSSSRIPFSIQFFLIGVIFLIFDVEIVLLFPLIVILKSSNLFLWMNLSFLFIFILLIGLYHEWNEGSLKWAI